LSFLQAVASRQQEAAARMSLLAFIINDKGLIVEQKERSVNKCIVVVKEKIKKAGINPA
jgi:hypothetical protein